MTSLSHGYPVKPEPPASESPKGQSLRMRCCELEWQSCNARRRDCGSARVWWPVLPTAKPPTRGALPRAFLFLKSPFSLLSKEKRGPLPPEGVKRICSPKHHHSTYGLHFHYHFIIIPHVFHFHLTVVVSHLDVGSWHCHL